MGGRRTNRIPRMTLYRITGNTFPHRETLKSWRARWNEEARAWEADLSSAQLATTRGWLGTIAVELPKPEPREIDWSQLFGDDEDEPPPAHRSGPTAVYGDDPRWLNHFRDQNPTAFFGFSSLGVFVDYVAGLRVPPSGRDDGWNTGSYPAKWTGTPDMAAALALARDGWQEGIQAAEALPIEPARARKRSYSVAGGSVSVGRLLAGNPLHMIHRPQLPGRRVVTLFVETFMSAGVSPENATTRAVLVAWIVDKMEREGYSCEIVAAVTTRGTNGRTGHQHAITLKNAGERLSLPDIVFALGHPSFFRRLVFASVGAASECGSTWETQGSPTAAFDDKHECGHNEFYIKQLSLSDQKKLTRDPLSMLPFISPL